MRKLIDGGILTAMATDLELQRQIKKDRQIKKFAWYGFLKDLKFFEPYLLIYLLGNGINLLSFGILFSIRELIVNVFEVPSGLIADRFGRKKSLCVCFIFYIISFIFFFFCTNFWLAAVAMIFFGLGEAFRSGTHKAMIFSYLEQNDWQSQKTFVYGKTRSASQLGIAASSVLAIVFMLCLPSSKYIFLASTIPYIIDFFLILSYPKTIDKDEVAEGKPRSIFKQLIGELKKDKTLRKLIVTEGLFDSTVSSVKDYVQPILSAYFLIHGVLWFSALNAEDNLSIVLGLVYCLIGIASAMSSKNVFRAKQRYGANTALNVLYIVLILTFGLLGIFVEKALAVCALFLLLNILLNARKPVFMDEVDNHIEKDTRATVLSISAQMKSLFIIIISPIIGYIADSFGINYAMYFLGALLLLSLPFIMLRSSYKKTAPKSEQDN